MGEHYLKTIEPYYSDIEQGYKDFEVRKRERAFDVGDTLVLQQYIDGMPTGKAIHRKIKYILFDESFVKEGYCVLGLENTQAEAEPQPRALTLGELQRMEGKPVWIENYRYKTRGYDVIQHVVLEPSMSFWFLGLKWPLLPTYYGEAWLAYDREPKGE